MHLLGADAKACTGLPMADPLSMLAGTGKFVPGCMRMRNGQEGSMVIEGAFGAGKGQNGRIGSRRGGSWFMEASSVS